MPGRGAVVVEVCDEGGGEGGCLGGGCRRKDGDGDGDDGADEDEQRHGTRHDDDAKGDDGNNPSQNR